jgi:hypothetical protein
MVATDVPPPNSFWWRRYWDSFKRNFPDRSGEQARSLVLVLLAIVSLFLLARILFAFWEPAGLTRTAPVVAAATM